MICNNLKECINEQLSGVHLGECDNKNKNTCIESSNSRSAVKCEEHSKKYVYENSKRNHVILYNMDGGIIVEDRTVPPNTNLKKILV